MKSNSLAMILGSVLGSTVLLTGFSGCTRSEHEPSAKSLQIQLTSDPASLDPKFAEDGIALKILSNVLEGLVSYDGAGKLRPALAERWEFSADQKTIRFFLRPLAKWSDDKPVTANQFVFAIERNVKTAPVGKLAAFYDVLDSVTAPDPTTVEFKLKKPCPYFLDLLTLAVAAPLREDQIQDGKFKEVSPSTGPYQIGAWSQDRYIVLEPNPYWWGLIGKTQFGYPPLVYRVVADDSAAVSLFESGKLDILTKFPPSELERLKKTSTLVREPYWATYFVAFNVRKAPFSELKARLSMASAIDRLEIVTALGTGEQPARGLIPEKLEGYLGAASGKQGTIGASSALQTAGATLGFDQSSRNKTVVEVLQSQWKKALGVNVQLDAKDWKAHLGALATNPPSIYRFAWQAPFADPITHLLAFTTGNPNNYTGWSDPQYDAWVEAIATMKSGPARTQWIEKAQRRLIEEQAVVLPLFHYVQNTFISKRVKNFRTNPLGVIRFDEMKLAP